jgi:hypothetical protein
MAIALGSLSQTIAYAIQSSTPPLFLVMAYSINGEGMALQVCRLAVHDLLVHLIKNNQGTQANEFVATLKDNSATKMG